MPPLDLRGDGGLAAADGGDGGGGAQADGRVAPLCPRTAGLLGDPLPVPWDAPPGARQ